MNSLARLIVRHPRKILIFWVAVLLFSGLLASRLSTRVQNGGFNAAGSQSQRADALGKRHFRASSTPQAYLAVLAEGADAAEISYDAHLASSAIRDIRGVEALGTPALSPDRRAVLVPVTLAGGIGTAQTYVPHIQDALDRLRLHSAISQLIGEAAVYERYMVQSKQSLQTSSFISFPLVDAILLVAFLSVAAALVPIGVAIVCLGTTFGFLYLMSYIVQLSVFAEDTALIIGLGLSIDFSLFLVTRVREAVARDGIALDEAIPEALATTGRAVAISGMTISVALGGLYVTGLGIFASLATGAIGASLIAVAITLTMTPALLVLLGERLERFSIRRAVDAARRGSFWRRLADFVVRRRVAVILAVVPLMLLMAIPVSTMHVNFKSFSLLPSSDPVRAASKRVATSFGPGVGTPAIVVAHASPARVRRSLVGQRGIAQVGPAELGSAGWVRVPATLDAEPDSASAVATVHRLRSSLQKAFGHEAVVGGPTAVGIDLIDRITARTPWVILVVLLAEVIFLTLVFAAPALALKAALTTLLSVAAALGVMTLLFRGTGDMGYFVPLFLFATIFGLSTDYEVFLLSRMREFHDEGNDNDKALKSALIRSARSITFAGLAMGVVFFSFAASPLGAWVANALGWDVLRAGRGSRGDVWCSEHGPGWARAGRQRIGGAGRPVGRIMRS